MQQREEEKNKRNNKASTNPMLEDLEDLLTPSTKSESQPKQAEGKNQTTSPQPSWKGSFCHQTMRGKDRETRVIHVCKGIGWV